MRSYCSNERGFPLICAFCLSLLCINWTVFSQEKIFTKGSITANIQVFGSESIKNTINKLPDLVTIANIEAEEGDSVTFIDITYMNFLRVPNSLFKIG
jgi:cystathionine beta-lyase/cystathionine gamma-synthase